MVENKLILEYEDKWIDSILIPYINVLSFKRSGIKWGYIIAGVIALIFAYMFAYFPLGELFFSIFLIAGIVCFILAWRRKSVLVVNSFGYRVVLESYDNKSLRELMDTIERIRSRI